MATSYIDCSWGYKQPLEKTQMFTSLIVIIPPTNAQLFFIIYIYLAYMFRPYPVIISALRYTKGFKNVPKIFTIYLLFIYYIYLKSSYMTCLCRHRGEAEVLLQTISIFGARSGWEVNTPPHEALPLQKGPSAHCTGRWVGLGGGMEGHGKSPLHRDSIRRPSSQLGNDIMTQLVRPPLFLLFSAKTN